MVIPYELAKLKDAMTAAFRYSKMAKLESIELREGDL